MMVETVFLVGCTLGELQRTLYFCSRIRSICYTVNLRNMQLIFTVFIQVNPGYINPVTKELQFAVILILYNA